MTVPDPRQLLDDIGHADGQAKSLASLYALYGLKGRERVALRRLVRRLTETGQLVRLRGGGRFGLPRRRETVEGLLTGTRGGLAFVSPDDPELPDALIPEGRRRGALHGDRVEVALLPDSDPKRPAGEVTRIVRRGDAQVVGLLAEGESGRGEDLRLRPFDARLAVPIVVPRRFCMGAEPGTYVAVTLLRDARGGARDGEPLGARVTAVLGRPDEPGTDVRVVVASFHLRDDHPAEAVAEAERQAATVQDAAEIARRTDLRDLPTVTIDGETAQDFDDAVSVERRGRLIRLHVHVADVAQHVVEGSPLDAEAYARGTSVYLPDRAIHMLPEALAAGACSLRPGEDKLTLTMAMDVDEQGEVTAVTACESIIRSDHRLTYSQVKGLLVDSDPALVRSLAGARVQLDLMAELANRLDQERRRRGCLDFDLPEPIVTLDENGLPIDVKPSERNLAHRMIEEFMIAANRAVARLLREAGLPCMVRVHEPPPPDKVAVFREAAAALGHDLDGDEAPPPAAFRAVLEAAAGRPGEAFLSQLALRTMSLARYSIEPLGHYGLAVSDYAHFTSPIRRYPDLIVHRLLKRHLAGERLEAGEGEDLAADLSEAAEHCSAAERRAQQAERTLREWKQVRFLEARIGERFEARVTGIADFGVFVVLRRYLIDGLVRFARLAPDRYEREASGLRLRGQRTGRVLRLGDIVRVRVVGVDTFLRQVDLEEA